MLVRRGGRALQSLSIDPKRDLLQQVDHQAAEEFAVSRLQVNEFDAGANGRDIAYHRSRLDPPQSGANFYLHRVAYN